MHLLLFLRTSSPLSFLSGVLGGAHTGGTHGGAGFMQQVSVWSRLRAGGDIVMGFLRDSVDSTSACSKKMYLTASSRANARQMTCSTSMLTILQSRDAVY